MAAAPTTACKQTLEAIDQEIEQKKEATRP
jgi:hypothetical protein